MGGLVDFRNSKNKSIFVVIVSALCSFFLFQNMTTLNHTEIISAVWKTEHIWGEPRLTTWYTNVPGYPQSAKIAIMIQDRDHKVYYRYAGESSDMMAFTKFRPIPVYLNADSFLLVFLSKERNVLKSYKVTRSNGTVSPFWRVKLPRAVSLAELSGAMHKTVNANSSYENILLRIGTVAVQGIETKSLFNLKDAGGCHPSDQHSELIDGQFVCVANERVCAIANGTGYQAWSASLGSYGGWRMCSTVLCNPGYRQSAFACSL